MSALQPEEREVRPSFPRIRRLDAAWYRGEQLACGVMFLILALIVFVAVVRDVFITHMDLAHAIPDVLITWAVVFAALLTRARKPAADGGAQPRRWKTELLKKLGVALVATLALAGIVAAYLEALPGGFYWAPKMALCIMLWVAFLGASMATHEKAHLSLEFGDKIWPKAALRWIRVFAHALTSAFSLALFILAVMSLVGHYDSWEAAGGQGATVASLDWLPEWAVYLIFPYVFLAMGVRFAAQMVTTAMGTDITPERGPS